MARVALAATKITDTGVDPDGATVAASANGHSFVDNGKRLLYMNNTDAASHEVHVQIPHTVEGLSVGPQVITVAAGKHEIAGPFGSVYVQQDGSTYVDVPTPAGVELAVLEVD